MKAALKFLSAILLVCFCVNLRAQTGPDIVWTINAHFEVVSGVAFSADSTRLCSGSPDHYWKVWLVPSADLVQSQFSLNVSHASIALSSNGSLLATGDDEGKTRVWEVSDATRLWIGGPDNRLVHSLAFSPDDALLAIGRSDAINIRYAANGLGIPFTELDQDIFGVCFSPDGKSLASANADHHASLWRVPEGTLVRDFVGHSNSVNSVDLSPDGKLLATASADDTARVWNVISAEPLVVMDGGGGTAKFTADGKYLFTLSDGTFKLWHVSSGTCVGSITNTGATTFDIARNGKYFAYGTGSGAVVLAQMPVVLDSITRAGNQTILKWQGGSGVYQLQSSTSLPGGTWQNVGSATTNTSATNIASSTLFFRVQNLPQP